MFLVSSAEYPWVELLDHMVVLHLIIWGISVFSIVAAPTTFASTVQERVPFFPHPCQYLLFVIFLIIAIVTGRWCLIAVLTWFPWWLVMLNIFSCACWSLYVFFGKRMPVQILYPFFNWTIWVLLLSWIIFIFWILTPLQIYH